MAITYLALTDTAITAADRGRVRGVTCFCGNVSLASCAPAPEARTPTRSPCLASMQVPPGSGASQRREHHGPVGDGVMTCIEGGVGQMWLANVVAEWGGGGGGEGAPPLVSCVYVVCVCV